MNLKNKSNHLALQGGNLIRRAGATSFIVLLCLFSCFVHAKENEIVPAAVRWYQEMAAQGDVEAKYNLGMMYETGWSVPVDIEKAIRWYRDAADEGNAEAQLRLGMIFYLGLGSSESKLKGESWIRKAANQKNKFAMQLIEKLFDDSESESLNHSEILERVRRVYLENGKKAEVALSQMISDAKENMKVLEMERERTTIKERREVRTVAKENKSEIIAANISDKKRKSEHIKNILPEFVGDATLKENRTLERGNIGTIRFQAEKGQASAQYNLGRMYDLGVKIPIDKKVALIWYEKAAAQGFADAEYRLAIAYLYGISTEKNEELGMKWLSAAASHGHQVAKNLQTKLESSEGLLISNQSIAVKWYLERAVAGDAESALRLGKIFQYGWGATPDLQEAVRWYKRASMLGAKEEAVKLLQTLDVDSIGKGADTTKFQSGGMLGEVQPSSWIAYLLAGGVAIVIFFWPTIMKRRKSKSEPLTTAIRRGEPPFR